MSPRKDVSTRVAAMRYVYNAETNGITPRPTMVMIIKQTANVSFSRQFCFRYKNTMVIHESRRRIARSRTIEINEVKVLKARSVEKVRVIIKSERIIF